ncbi:anti-sigma factor domain-containing protein [Zhouia amylolytica]|uniref:anti-sigma factor domain-containing protein n=1 Tax=Zhouia amylolytica TaxID=376730 RepID=UPI0020CE146A|nr:anti-sigma factor [Zhouia amylolytica]MCQ0111189.1 anti-sigma factor [Zhouia amylolytica]
MKKDVKILLESDLLEKYLLGDITTLEETRIEHYIETHPEVAERYNELQENLEIYAKAHAKPIPVDIKSKVLEIIEKEDNHHSSKRGMPWYYVAASVAAFAFAATTVLLWNQNRLLSTEKNSVASQISNLKNEIVATNSKLQDMKSNYAVLNNPETKKYVLSGNERARQLKTVAYINPEEKLSAINIVSLPNLSEEKEFQMWANVDGVLVHLGTLEKADQKLLSLPYQEGIKGYKIYMVPKGFTGEATAENMVASIDLD